jgi:hypothetical protein
VARVGDEDSKGQTLCWIGYPRINDAGEVAFDAEFALSQQECSCRVMDDESELCPLSAIYKASRGELQRVVAAGHLSPPDWQLSAVRLIQLNHDGSVTFTAHGSSLEHPTWSFHILVSRAEHIESLVSAGEVGADGTPLQDLATITGNSKGDVAFFERREAGASVYRTEGGRLVQVLAAQEPTPTGGSLYWVGDSLFLNDRGDVAFQAGFLPSGGDESLVTSEAIFVYPRDADGELVIAPGWIAGLNDSRDAIVGHLYREDYATAWRWRQGSLEKLVATGDPAPGGGVFAEQGLEGPNCLGPSGQVGATAYRNNDQALLCVDSQGAQLVARKGDPAPEWGHFDLFGQCAFTDDHALLFAGMKLVPYDTFSYALEAAVYRASANGIERVIGAGDVAADGSIVPSQSNAIFASNGRGSVVLRNDYDLKPSLLFRKAGEPLQRIEIGSDLLPGGGPVARIKALGLTEGDTAVVLLGSDYDQSGVDTILLVGADGSRVLTTETDPALPGAPFNQIDQLLVRGHFVAFAATSNSESRLFLYRTREPAPREVTPQALRSPGWSPPRIIDISEDGTMLLSAWHSSDGNRPHNFLVDDHGLEPLTSGERDLDAIATNTRRNVLFQAWSSPLGSPRRSLLLSGPTSEARCFAPPTAVPQTPPVWTPTATFGPTPTPTPWCLDPDQCTRVEIGAARGGRGETVAITATLHVAAEIVAGVQNDINVPPDVGISFRRCRVNGGIEKNGSAFALLPSGCTPGVDCTRARAIVLSFENVDPIADGAVLYSCEVAISADARPGTHELSITNVYGSDPVGREIWVTGVAGAISVVSSDVRRLELKSGQAKAAASFGCQLQRSAGWEAELLLLASFSSLLAIRRRAWSKKRARPLASLFEVAAGERDTGHIRIISPRR